MNESELFSDMEHYVRYAAYCHGHNVYISEKFTYELDGLEESNNGVSPPFSRLHNPSMMLDDPVRRRYYRSNVLSFGATETVETDKL